MSYTFTKEMDAIMENMPFGFVRADLHANVVHSNGYLQKLYGVGYDRFEGTAWQQLIHPDDKKRILMLFAKDYFSDKVTLAATRLVFNEDLIVPVMFLIDSLFDESNKRIGFMVNIVDVTLAIHDLCPEPVGSHVDPLTRLPVRADFLVHLGKVLQSRKKHRSAIILIDFKGLENINQFWGYAVGDELLVALSDRLRVSGKKYFLGRVESDKFGLIIDSIEHIDALKEIVARVQASCNESITLPQGKFLLAASLGVALSVQEEMEVDVLLRHAYEALSAAKKKGTTMEFFDEKMHRVYRRNSRIVASLFDAISQDQFELHYQPQVDAATDKLIGIEVLLRWKHPELGIIGAG